LKLVCLDCKKTFVYVAKFDCEIPGPNDGVVQKSVCPYCLSINIDEYTDQKPEISSVVSVPIEEVDAKLKEGYVVKDLYAKTATLIKLAQKEAHA